MYPIDTRHGTNNQHSFSHGNCLPYTGVPFGMNYFAPQTNGDNGSWWFNPNDRTFQGFRLTHQPSPWMGDFSRLLFMPISGQLAQRSIFHAQSSYRPEESLFRPNQLKITSLRYQSTSWLIPSCYGGILTTDYTQKDAGLLLALSGRFHLEQVDAHTLEGWVINFSGCEDPDFKFYFMLKTENAFTLTIADSTEDGLAELRFGDIATESTHFATSFISLEQARLNLTREETLSADDLLAQSEAQWQDYLQKIEITHHDKKQVDTFYHNFYRMFLFPQTFYELDENESPIHYDTYNKEVKAGVLYTNNGFWDTYKTVYPMYSLIAPDKYGEMLEGFLNSYNETGFLPKWLSPDERGLMPGTLIDAVIADAAEKNIRPDLMPKLLAAMKKAATVQSKNPNYGRQGTADYLKYGYVPLDYHESVNHTLDYCYSDFCIATVAKAVGDDEAAFYQKQSKNYLNIFDSTTGFMRAKDKEGVFRENFDSRRWGRDYAEGSAWQSSYAVYHDFAGLKHAHGGTDAFVAKLIELCNQAPAFTVEGYGFEIHEMSEMAALEFGQLAISNQPSFHYPYLFSYAGKPEMAQPLIKQLLTQAFNASYDGYPGDEDNGSMAGWFVFSSLGFYPVTPGSGQYVIGMPLFDQVKIHLGSGKTLTITATPNKPQQLFVEQITRDNASYDKLFFTHEDLLQGGQIDFKLGIVPHPKAHTAQELPFSL